MSKQKVINQTKQIVQEAIALGHEVEPRVLYGVKNVLLQLLEQLPERVTMWNEYIRQIDELMPRKHFESRECSGECIVCMNEMSNGYIARCGHKFHVKCISTWADHSYSCPVCRSEL
jgi:hypothetical protein